MLETIKTFIETGIHGGTRKITLDQNLLETGVLDSLSVLKLITFLEQKFDFTFSMKEMRVQNMQTLEKIISFVEFKLAAKRSKG